MHIFKLFDLISLLKLLSNFYKGDQRLLKLLSSACSAIFFYHWPKLKCVRLCFTLVYKAEAIINLKEVNLIFFIFESTRSSLTTKGLTAHNLVLTDPVTSPCFRTDSWPGETVKLLMKLIVYFFWVILCFAIYFYSPLCSSDGKLRCWENYLNFCIYRLVTLHTKFFLLW